MENPSNHNNYEVGQYLVVTSVNRTTGEMTVSPDWDHYGDHLYHFEYSACLSKLEEK